MLEAGPRAYLDGASALIAAGLENFRDVHIRVSVPRGARVYRRLPGVNIRQTRRWCAEDVVGTGLPRARPAVAAVRAALWARSNREAALVLTMSVQQGLTTAAEPDAFFAQIEAALAGAGWGPAGARRTA